MAAMYAVYHGPHGLMKIAKKVHEFTKVLKERVQSLGYTVENETFFDTLTVHAGNVSGAAKTIHKAAEAAGLNLRHIDDSRVGVTLDEGVSSEDLVKLINVFTSATSSSSIQTTDLSMVAQTFIPDSLRRTSEFLSHPVFNTHHSETEMLRYIHHLQSKDLSLVHAMIPLGSCTMKLNSTSSMIPLTWPEFNSVHPFVPVEQAKGYLEVIKVRSRLLFGSLSGPFNILI